MWAIHNCRFRRRATLALLFVGLCAFASKSPAADIPAFSLDQGFHLLYDLNFDQAHQVFASWQQQHPDDPMGAIGDAAGSLFA